MPTNRRVVPPTLDTTEGTIANKVKNGDSPDVVIVNFSKLKISPVCLSGKFNNHFKDSEHFEYVAANFLGTILPKITSHTYNEIANGGSEGKILHFHTIDEVHLSIVREVLEAYHYPKYVIDQMLEGNDIIEFSASLGHVHAARIVCHKIKNVLYLLFFDTNHHIYMDEKYVSDSFFFDDCPKYKSDECPYMPSECFAVGYLNEQLIRESFNYSFSP